MTLAGWILLVIAVVVLAAWYLSYSASRLDRLHARVEGSLSSLDAQIVRRAEAGLELANSGALDPVSLLVLGDAAAASLEESDRAAVHTEVQEHGVDHVRAMVESNYSQALRTILSPEAIEYVREHDGTERLDLVRDAAQRVVIARNFYNESVRDVRRIRGRLVVRVFRLAGRTYLPHEVEFDDRLPEGL